MIPDLEERVSTNSFRTEPLDLPLSKFGIILQRLQEFSLVHESLAKGFISSFRGTILDFYGK